MPISPPAPEARLRTYLTPAAVDCTAVTLALFLAIASGSGHLERAGVSIGLIVVMALLLTALIARWRANDEQLAPAAPAAPVESEARFSALVQHSSDMILILDVDGMIRYASPAAEDSIGRSTVPLAGSRLIEFVHPDDAPEAMRTLARVCSHARTSARAEWRLIRRDGSALLAEHVATNLIDEPAVGGIVLNCRDVSDRVELQRQLAHQAFHDPLTQLANRALFLDRLDHAMRMRGRGGSGLALLLFDLDDFKRINDSMGHAAGDALLMEMSARILRGLRDGDTLARLGGDEFAILLEETTSSSGATRAADRVLSLVSAPFTIEGKQIIIGASVGIAVAADKESPSDIMRNADLAMYIAKTRGKGGSAVYEPHMHSDALTRVELEADLRRAVERNEFMLVFQPVVRLDTRELVGVESLLRWPHPTRGHVPPAQFVPIAERTGLIVPIGRWALREACRQARRWRDASGRELRVAVNISGRQILDPVLLDDVHAAIVDADLQPSQLMLELTESILMERTSDVRRVLLALKSLGVSMALDDFGTGYSSLSYLQRFPIDVLKIDQSFVEPMATAAFDPRLVRAIIALGESLGLPIVAEGIETTAQLHALHALGCTFGQGYLFARPMSADGIELLLRNDFSFAGDFTDEIEGARAALTALPAA